MRETTSDILRGVKIILYYEPRATFAAEHDIIFFGTYNAEEMTPADRGELEVLGWHKQYDSWAHFI